MGRGVDVFYGVVFVLAGLVLSAGLVAGVAGGEGPNAVLLLILVVGALTMFALAAAFLGPATWHPALLRVTVAGLAVVYLGLALAGLLAPSLVADSRSSRGPETEHGARVMGVVMLAPVLVLGVLPWLVRRVRGRR